jgi:hypothetical protein
MTWRQNGVTGWRDLLSRWGYVLILAAFFILVILAVLWR